MVDINSSADVSSSAAMTMRGRRELISHIIWNRYLWSFLFPMLTLIFFRSLHRWKPARQTVWSFTVAIRAKISWPLSWSTARSDFYTTSEASTHVIRLNLKRPINDNRWHDVGVIHKSLTEYILKVDDTLKRESLSDVHSVHFDMDDVLYIGGVPKWMYSNFPREVEHFITRKFYRNHERLEGDVFCWDLKFWIISEFCERFLLQLKSRTGFQGCLASVDLGGTTLSIDDQKVEIRSEFRDQIQDRCECEYNASLYVGHRL